MVSSQTSIQLRYEKILDKTFQYKAENASNGAAQLKSADQMREWIFRHTPRASGEAGTLCTIEPYQYSTGHILEELRNSASGYWCAGYASLLVCAYRDLGLKAATIAFGVEGGFTHALTAVEIENVWFLQDPYTNMRFAATAGQNSFAAIWKRVNAGQDIHLISSPSRLQPFVFSDQDKLASNVIFPFGYHQLDKGKKIGLFHVSVGQLYQHPLWPSTEPHILHNPGQDPLSALFCYPLWLADPKFGYHECAQKHPFWPLITGQNNMVGIN